MKLKESNVRKGKRITVRSVYKKLGASRETKVEQEVRKRRSNRKRRLPFSFLQHFSASYKEFHFSTILKIANLALHEQGRKK
jgi:hypothetical protein